MSLSINYLQQRSSRLVDYFCVVGLEDEISLAPNPVSGSIEDGLQVTPLEATYKSVVLDRYPLEDREDVEFFDGVTIFCFPEGLKLRDQMQLPTFFTFVQTDVNGDRMYGHVLTFYEPLTETQKTSLDSIHNAGFSLGQTSSASYDYMAPKALCLLSTWPFISEMKEWLSKLYQLSLSAAPLPLERVVQNLLDDVPCPVAGRTEVLYEWAAGLGGGGGAAAGGLTFRVPPPNDPTAWGARTLPHAALFECLSVDHVLQLFAAVLCERQVLVVSSYLYPLTACMEVVLLLLYPLAWPHVYIPVCPRALLGVLAAPCPLLVGTKREFLTAETEVPDEVVRVDLDRDAVALGPAAAPLPPLPPRRRDKLAAALAPFGPLRAARGHEPGAEGGAWERERLPRMEQALPQSANPSDSDYDKERRRRQLAAGLDWARAREAALRFMAAVLKDHARFVSASATEDSQGSVFDQAAFLEAQPRDWRPFLRELTNTQAFASFIDSRVAPGPGDDPDVRFFEGTIAAKLNRSKFQLRKKDTDFLQPRTEPPKTVVAPAPSRQGLEALTAAAAEAEAAGEWALVAGGPASPPRLTGSGDPATPEPARGGAPRRRPITAQPLTIRYHRWPRLRPELYAPPAAAAAPWRPLSEAAAAAGGGGGGGKVVGGGTPTPGRRRQGGPGGGGGGGEEGGGGGGAAAAAAATATGGRRRRAAFTQQSTLFFGDTEPTTASEAVYSIWLLVFAESVGRERRREDSGGGGFDSGGEGGGGAAAGRRSGSSRSRSGLDFSRRSSRSSSGRRGGRSTSPRGGGGGGGGGGGRGRSASPRGGGGLSSGEEREGSSPPPPSRRGARRQRRSWRAVLGRADEEEGEGDRTESNDEGRISDAALVLPPPPLPVTDLRDIDGSGPVPPPREPPPRRRRRPSGGGEGEGEAAASGGGPEEEDEQLRRLREGAAEERRHAANAGLDLLLDVLRAVRGRRVPVGEGAFRALLAAAARAGNAEKATLVAQWAAAAGVGVDAAMQAALLRALALDPRAARLAATQSLGGKQEGGNDPVFWLDTGRTAGGVLRAAAGGGGGGDAAAAAPLATPTKPPPPPPPEDAAAAAATPRKAGGNGGGGGVLGGAVSRLRQRMTPARLAGRGGGGGGGGGGASGNNAPRRTPGTAVTGILGTVVPPEEFGAAVRHQFFLGNQLLETLYPGLEIDTESETCPQCARGLSLGDAKYGWRPDPNSYVTECPFCVAEARAAAHSGLGGPAAAQRPPRRFVPRFSVTCRREDWAGTTRRGPGAKLWCEFLSPWALRKELRTLALGGGGGGGGGGAGPGEGGGAAAASGAAAAAAAGGGGGGGGARRPGAAVLLDPNFAARGRTAATVWWNLVVHFREHHLPFTFLFLESIPGAGALLVSPMMDDG